MQWNNGSIRKAAARVIPALLLAVGPAGNVAMAADVSISGTVTFSGPRPEQKPLDIKRDPKCVALHGDSPLLAETEVVAADGGVAHVFVSVKNPPEGMEHPIPETAAVMNQVGCRYIPHVLGIRAGQTLDVTNSDELLHNVRSYARVNRAFNLAQPQPGVRQKIFKMAESAVKIKCDIHPWMTAYIFSMNHPFFATTDTAGSFKIDGLPAGKYTLEAWHEKYGKMEISVDASGGSVSDAKITFAPAD